LPTDRKPQVFGGKILKAIPIGTMDKIGSTASIIDIYLKDVRFG
jgi:hypothetical protein